MNVYSLTAHIAHEPLPGLGFVATAVAGHHKVKGLYGFGDSRETALTALAQVVFATLVHSRFDATRVDAIALIEVHTIPVDDLGLS